jgi:hypothetical protein
VFAKLNLVNDERYRLSLAFTGQQRNWIAQGKKTKKDRKTHEKQ